MMRKAAAPLAILCLLVLAPCAASAQFSLLYRETAGARQITNRMSQEILPGGYFMRSRLSDGDMHDVQIDTSLQTISYHVTSPARRIDYTAVRTGNVLVVDGILGGRPVSKRITIDARPWYESFERSAKDFVMAGVRAPVVYWIIHPWEASAYLLQARGEGREQVMVNGSPVDAVRVRVSPVGLLRFFWSALYWYRPDDGRFVRYEGVRGPPGTPKTIVELLDNG